MALTTEDLLAISQLLDTKLDSKFKAELQPIKEDLLLLKEDVQVLKEDVQALKEDVQTLKEDVQVLKNDVQVLKDEVQVLRENQLALDLKITKTQLHLENITDKNVQFLAENYVPAAKRYEKASAQLEIMQSDIDLIKKVVTDHSQRLQILG